MKKYDYLALKAAQVTLRNAAERKGSWWKMFARYAEIAKRKIWYLEIGLFFCLILVIGGCNIMRESLHLGGAACQDAGWLLQKGADNIKIQEK